MLVFVQINGVLGADRHAGVGNAALAAVGNANLLGGAGITGKGDNIDQRLPEILLIRSRLPDAGAEGLRRTARIQIHAQSQPDSGGHHRPLQKYVMPVVSHLSGNDLIGNHIHTGIIIPAVGQPGHLCKYAAANIVYRAVYTSHSLLLCPANGRIPSRSIFCIRRQGRFNRIYYM